MNRLRNYVLIGQSPVEEPDLKKWGEWFERNAEARVVARTDVGAYVVSTVFLGIDHQFGKGPPLLFETMVFIDGEAEDIQRRCPTWLEAERQHAQVVALVRDRQRPHRSR